MIGDIPVGQSSTTTSYCWRRAAISGRRLSATAGSMDARASREWSAPSTAPGLGRMVRPGGSTRHATESTKRGFSSPATIKRWVQLRRGCTLSRVWAVPIPGWRSTSSVRCPCSWSRTARFAASRLVPLPPFIEQRATTLPRWGAGAAGEVAPRARLITVRRFRSSSGTRTKPSTPRRRACSRVWESVFSARRTAGQRRRVTSPRAAGVTSRTATSPAAWVRSFQSGSSLRW